MRRFWIVMAIVALLGAACGSGESTVDSDDSDAADTAQSGDETMADDSAGDSVDSDDDADDPEFTGAGRGDFCATVRAYADDDPLENLTPADGPVFFDRANEVWSGILPDVPDEIRPDVETIIAGFEDMRDVAEEYDYDLFDPEAIEAMDVLDTAEQERAFDRFEAYVEDVCEVDLTEDPSTDEVIVDRDVPGVPPEFIAEMFGVDIETAECLIDELGGDPTQLDPSKFTGPDQEICGVTFNELLAGMGGR